MGVWQICYITWITVYILGHTPKSNSVPTVTHLECKALQCNSPTLDSSPRSTFLRFLEVAQYIPELSNARIPDCTQTTHSTPPSFHPLNGEEEKTSIITANQTGVVEVHLFHISPQVTASKTKYNSQEQ